MSAPRAHDDEQDRIDLAASEWVVLAGDRELTSDEERELDAWLAADPRHHAAWRAFEATWATLPALTGLTALTPAPAEFVEQHPARLQRWLPRISAAAITAIAAVLLAMFAAPALWQSQPERYRTGLAQTQLITLDDGSQVTLGPRSELSVTFSQKERRVQLGRGEAFFEVAHNADRPFLVDAGGSVTRVVGTKFDVNYGAASVRVAVLEGLVQVSEAKAAGTGQPRIALLRAGQHAEISLVRPGIAVAQRPAEAPGAWREGRLIYENVRLADLVADVNRYYAPGVTLADAEIGDLRITASFKASEIAAFMSAVGDVIPVTARERPGGAILLAAARK